VSSWPLSVLALCLFASGTCLATELPQAGGKPLATQPGAVNLHHRLNLDLPLQALGADDTSSAPDSDHASARPDDSQSVGSERRMPLFDLQFGQGSSLGRIPGDPPPVFGEVGIDLGSRAGLSLEPSYRVVLGQDDRPDSHAISEQILSHAISEQVLKLGARIRF
jgi:hypothetical protein